MAFYMIIFADGLGSFWKLGLVILLFFVHVFCLMYFSCFCFKKEIFFDCWYLFFASWRAKLISELAEKDAINYGLFKQAHDASLDKFLDEYVMSKFHHVLYDIEEACVNIKAGSKGIFLEVWFLCSALEINFDLKLNALFKTKSDAAFRFRSFTSSVLFQEKK